MKDCSPCTLSFAVHLGVLQEVMEWLRKQMATLHIPEVQVTRIELALEEALVNIISHSLLTEKACIELSCYLDEEQCLELTIKDRAPPFNPLSVQPDLQSDLSLEERKEGGLGLLMIRKFMDRLDYRREEGANILVMRKKITDI